MAYSPECSCARCHDQNRSVFARFKLVEDVLTLDQSYLAVNTLKGDAVPSKVSVDEIQCAGPARKYDAIVVTSLAM